MGDRERRVNPVRRRIIPSSAVDGAQMRASPFLRLGSAIAVGTIAFALVVILLALPAQATTTWQATLSASCSGPLVSNAFPAGTRVSVTWTLPTPGQNGGGTWVNASGPAADQGYAGYAALGARSSTQTLIFGFTSVGGTYTFHACAVGWTAGEPGVLRASYTPD